MAVAAAAAAAVAAASLVSVSLSLQSDFMMAPLFKLAAAAHPVATSQTTSNEKTQELILLQLTALNIRFKV